MGDTIQAADGHAASDWSGGFTRGVGLAFALVILGIAIAFVTEFSYTNNPYRDLEPEELLAYHGWLRFAADVFFFGLGIGYLETVVARLRRR